MSELPVGFEAGVSRALGRAGHPVTNVRGQRLTGGASAETWSLDADTASGLLALILRRSVPGIVTFGSANTKATEAAAQECARMAGVPTARVLAVFEDADGLGDGYVMQRCVGETIPRKLLRDSRYAALRASITAECGRVLAKLHSADFTTVPGLHTQSAAQQLDELEAYYREVSPPRAVFEVALRELRATLPSPAPNSLVHGDFRNGNLLVDERGIVAVLDWELTRAGDPMEDLGWLCVNAWRFGEAEKPVGGFGSRAQLFEAYEAHGGRSVERARVRFWELLGTFKWGVICLFQVHTFLSGSTPSLERAAIGRRLSEVDVDLLDILEGSP